MLTSLIITLLMANRYQTLQEKAEKIANNDSAIKKKNTCWKVASQSNSGKWYKVHIAASGMKCTCIYNQKRGVCKHAKAVELVMLRDAKSKSNVKEEPVKLDDVKPHCPKCKESRIIKDGRRNCKRRAPTQRYRCTKCSKRFSGEPGFSGRHHSTESILFSLVVFSMGLSPPQIALALRESMRINISHITIRRWTAHYCLLVEHYASTLNINAGFKWSTDEKYLKIRGEKHWLFAVMDVTTRFILSWDVSTTKQGYNACRLFAKAQSRAGHLPIIFVSDGLHRFKTAFCKVLKSVKVPSYHFREIHMKKERVNNNIHERFNGMIADLIGHIRGLKNANSAQISAFLVHYNFVRPHAGLGGITPARAAGIHISSMGSWRTLINHAALAA